MAGCRGAAEITLQDCTGLGVIGQCCFEIRFSLRRLYVSPSVEEVGNWAVNERGVERPLLCQASSLTSANFDYCRWLQRSGLPVTFRATIGVFGSARVKGMTCGVGRVSGLPHAVCAMLHDERHLDEGFR